ncbi:MAG: cytochrome c-type biogenesis CcmF C-terminal domain-containing protein, partial [Paracoccaceae bacterium]
FSAVSREGGLVLNNIILIVAAGTVFLGTFYPLLVELVGPDKISVGPPYYNRTFVPLMIPLLIAVAIGPLLRWKRDGLRAALSRANGAFVLAVLTAVVVTAFAGIKLVGAAAGLGLAAWLVFGSLTVLVRRTHLFADTPARSLRLALTTPRATYGMVLAHLGLGLFVAGVTCVTAWNQEQIVALAPGESVSAGGYEFTLTDVRGGAGSNYQSEQGTFAVTRDGEPVLTMTSERRFYPVSNRVTTEAGISPRGLTNLYIAFGEANDAGRWVVRVWYHPFVLLIWIGPILMALGGVLSLADRRMRIGAPAPKPAPTAITATAEA